MSRRSRTLVSIFSLSLSIMLFPSTARLQENTEPVASAEQYRAANNEQGSTVPQAGAYTIKQGDTLWDISNDFLKDPFLWPLIWKDNPTITNPDLIYPGRALTIPSLAPIEKALHTPDATAPAEERIEHVEHAEPAPPTIAAPAVAPAAEAVKPSQNPVEPEAVQTPAPQKTASPSEPAPEATPARSTLIIPKEAALPLVDKYAMLSAGFISAATYADTIIGSREPKTILGNGDIVFLKFGTMVNVHVGDKFSILAPRNKVRHPKTGKKFGMLFKVVGILQVTEKSPDTWVTAAITTCFDAVSIGYSVIPYEEPPLLFKATENGGRNISASIIEVTDSRTINGHYDVVYIDKGSADGVKPGDHFTVSLDAIKKGFPRKTISRLLVITVKDHTATAIVQGGTEPVEKGDRVDLHI